MTSLEGRMAIVTGAARGTGAVIARRFVEQGATVLLGDILHEEAEDTAAQIGDGAHFVPHDVTKPADWGAVVARALELGDRIDVLVNNAAVLHLGTIMNTPEDVLRRVLEVNTVGPYLGMRAVVPVMRKQGGGSIVNVGSVDSLIG
ncbi:MAG: SDR family NAD(P)-dependent oxidoreductase, partial [Myxococcota bacterium]